MTVRQAKLARRATVRFITPRTAPTLLALLSMAAVALLACSGPSRSAQALKAAELSCSEYLPKVNFKPDTTDAEVNAEFVQIKAAAAHAGKAASLDSKWDALNKAHSAMLDTLVYTWRS